jgi:hypothetical protein
MAHLLHDKIVFVAGQAAVKIGRGHIRIPQGLHLVLHQGDQRRDDDSQAGENQAGNLIAERLAAACGHNRQGVPAAQHIAHHLGLERTEIVVAEDLLEQNAGRIQAGRKRDGGRWWDRGQGLVGFRCRFGGL